MAQKRNRAEKKQSKSKESVMMPNLSSVEFKDAIRALLQTPSKAKKKK